MDVDVAVNFVEMFDNTACNRLNVQGGTKFSQKVALPITRRDSLIEKSILKEYECPVCLNFTTPPIMMCINSHVICFDCWKRCISCPTCRVPKTFTRALTLEKIHPLITFPCRWEGCSYMANASYIGIHEQVCKYFPIKCPLSDTHLCDWMGTMNTIQQHLRDLHEDNVYFQSSVFLMSRCFAKSVKKDYTVVFVIEDRLFKFYWSFDTSRASKVRFGMVSIGNGNPLVIYNYSLVFARHFPISRNCRKFKTVKSQIKKSFADCSSIERNPGVPRSKIFNYEHDYTDLVSFCNRGNLIYQVIIEVSHMTNCRKNNRM